MTLDKYFILSGPISHLQNERIELYNEDLLLDLQDLKNRWPYRELMSAKSPEFLMNVDWCIFLESRHLAKLWKSLAPSLPFNRWATNGLANKAPVAALIPRYCPSQMFTFEKEVFGEWLAPITQQSTRHKAESWASDFWRSLLFL